MKKFSKVQLIFSATMVTILQYYLLYLLIKGYYTGIKGVITSSLFLENILVLGPLCFCIVLLMLAQISLHVWLVICFIKKATKKLFLHVVLCSAILFVSFCAVLFTYRFSGLSEKVYRFAFVRYVYNNIYADSIQQWLKSDAKILISDSENLINDVPEFKLSKVSGDDEYSSSDLTLEMLGPGQKGDIPGPKHIKSEVWPKCIHGTSANHVYVYNGDEQSPYYFADIVPEGQMWVLIRYGRNFANIVIGSDDMIIDTNDSSGNWYMLAPGAYLNISQYGGTRGCSALFVNDCKDRNRQEGYLSKKEIIQIAGKAAEEKFNLEGNSYGTRFDRDNEIWNKHFLKDYHDYLEGRDYQAVEVNRKGPLIVGGGPMWVCIDKKTGEVIIAITGL